MPRFVQTDQPSSPGRSKRDGAADGVRKPRRHRRGWRARQEVRRYTRSLEPLLKRAPFRRVVLDRMCHQFREVTGRTAVPGSSVRLARDALEVMQCATENFLVRLVTAANDDVRRRKKIRLRVRDVRSVYALLYPQMAKRAPPPRTTRNSRHGREPPAAVTRRAQPKPPPAQADGRVDSGGEDEDEDEPMDDGVQEEHDDAKEQRVPAPTQPPVDDTAAVVTAAVAAIA